MKSNKGQTVLSSYRVSPVANNGCHLILLDSPEIGDLSRPIRAERRRS